MVAAGKLKPRVSREVVFAEDDVRQAFAQLHSRRVIGFSFVFLHVCQRVSPYAGVSDWHLPALVRVSLYAIVFVLYGPYIW